LSHGTICTRWSTNRTPDRPGEDCGGFIDVLCSTRAIFSAGLVCTWEGAPSCPVLVGSGSGHFRSDFCWKHIRACSALWSPCRTRVSRDSHINGHEGCDSLIRCVACIGIVFGQTVPFAPIQTCCLEISQLRHLHLSARRYLKHYCSKFGGNSFCSPDLWFARNRPRQNRSAPYTWGC